MLAVLESWAFEQGLVSDGYTLIIKAFLIHPIQQTSTSDVKEPWMDIYDRLSQANALYLKPVASVETAQDYSLLSFIYIIAVLRQTSLLTCVWSSKGWGPLAITSMLQPGSTSYLKKIAMNNSLVTLDRLSIVSGITRSQIASALSQAHGPWLLHLRPHERLVVLEYMVSIYNCIGFKRKEVYVLREVISCIMDLVVCGRDEDHELRKSDAGITGLEVAPADLTNNSGSATAGGVGVRRNENIDGNRSIIQLLNYACKVLGVHLESVNILPPLEGEPESSKDFQVQLEDTELFSSLNVSFGWPELQVGVIREAIAVAEALPGG